MQMEPSGGTDKSSGDTEKTGGIQFLSLSDFFFVVVVEALAHISELLLY